MHEAKNNWSFILRLDQIGVALIPVAIGFLALLNDITSFSSTLKSMAVPLMTMQGQTSQTWRALPLELVKPFYILMFLGEFLVGVLAIIGVIVMVKNIHKDHDQFEKAKRWVYLACG